MKITHRSVTINTAGYVDRLERGFPIKRTNTSYLHIKEPILVQKPQIEDFNNLVVVHDSFETYL